MCEKKELDEKLFDQVSKEMLEEIKDASAKFRSFVNYHHGYAVLKEEVDELWDKIKKTTGKGQRFQQAEMYDELIQIGAMTFRFINDLLDPRPRIFRKRRNFIDFTCFNCIKNKKILIDYIIKFQSYTLCEECFEDRYPKLYEKFEEEIDDEVTIDE